MNSVCENTDCQITAFKANAPFLYPLKKSRCLTFSGGIEVNIGLVRVKQVSPITLFYHKIIL